jgi:hypothetical protein
MFIKADLSNSEGVAKVTQGCRLHFCTSAICLFLHLRYLEILLGAQELVLALHFRWGCRNR